MKMIERFNPGLNIRRKYCSRLPGVLSSKQNFVWDYNVDGVTNTTEIPITEIVPSWFEKDEDYGIFYDQNGAVMDAYSIEGLTDVQKNIFLASKFDETRAAHPKYSIKIAPGNFPISCKGRETPIKTTFSNYVLYLSNWREQLSKDQSDDEDEKEIERGRIK